MKYFEAGPCMLCLIVCFYPLIFVTILLYQIIFTPLYIAPHWIQSAVITKWRKFYAKTSHASGFLHFAGKVTSISPRDGEVLRHKHWSDHNSSIYPGDVKACMWLLCNNHLLWPIIAANMAVSRMDTPEWSDFLCKVAMRELLFMGPCNHLIGGGQATLYRAVMYRVSNSYFSDFFTNFKIQL